LISGFIAFAFKFSLQQSSLPQLMLFFLAVIATSSFVVESSFKLSLIHFESIFLGIFSTCLPLNINPVFQAVFLGGLLFFIVFLLQITHIRTSSGKVDVQCVVTNINLSRRIVFSLIISFLVLALGLPLFFLVPKFAIKLDIDLRGGSTVDFKNVSKENLGLIIAKKGGDMHLRENAVIPYVRSLISPSDKKIGFAQQKSGNWRQPKAIKEKRVKGLLENDAASKKIEDNSAFEQLTGSSSTDKDKNKGEASQTSIKNKTEQITEQIKSLTAKIAQAKTLYRLISRMKEDNYLQTEKAVDIAKRIEQDELKLTELKQKLKELDGQKKSEFIEDAQFKKNSQAFSGKLKAKDKRLAKNNNSTNSSGAGLNKKNSEGSDKGSGEKNGETGSGSGEGKDGYGEGTGQGKDGYGEGTGQGKDGYGEGTGQGKDGYSKGKDGYNVGKESAGSSGGNSGSGSEGSSGSGSQGSSAGSSQGSSAGSSEGSSAGSSQGSSAGSSEGSSAGSSQGSSAGSSEGSFAGSSQGSSAGSYGGDSGSNRDNSSNSSSNNVGDSSEISHENTGEALEDSTGNSDAASSDIVSSEFHISNGASSGEGIGISKDRIYTNEEVKREKEKSTTASVKKLGRMAPLGKFFRGKKIIKKPAGIKKYGQSKTSKKYRKTNVAQSEPRFNKKTQTAAQKNTNGRRTTTEKKKGKEPKEQSLTEKVLSHKLLPDFIKENMVLLYGFVTLIGILFAVVVFYFVQFAFYGLRKVINDLRLFYFNRTNPNLFIIYLYRNLRFIFLKLHTGIKDYMSPEETVNRINASLPFEIKDEFSLLTHNFVKSRYSNHLPDNNEISQSVTSYDKIKCRIIRHTEGVAGLLLSLQMFSLFRKRKEDKNV